MPAVHCLGCGKPGTVLRAGYCARCAAVRRWSREGQPVAKVIVLPAQAPVLSHLLAEVDDDDPPPRAA